MITLDQLEQYVDALPSLYEKHRVKPGSTTKDRNEGCMCALEIIALDLKLRHWTDVLVGQAEDDDDEVLTAFYLGFDGHAPQFVDPPPRTARAYELGRRARKVVGL